MATASGGRGTATGSGGAEQILLFTLTLIHLLYVVNTNTLMWEFIGTVTWVYTNKPTWELNRYRRPTRPDQTRPDTL
jgi:hypothetical protein